jgi:predicted ArsR family transcriptional regulator
MDRTEFLRGCSGALCACILADGIVPGETCAGDAAPAEDWRLRFVRRRYARLVGILSEKVGEGTLNAILRDLGAYCSSTDPRLSQYRGDLGGYRAHIKETASGDDVAFDRERGVITVTSPERTDCFCPLISVESETPQVVCNCSLGWHQATWGTVTGKKVRVELKESVLSGGKRCTFEVQVPQEDT